MIDLRFTFKLNSLCKLIPTRSFLSFAGLVPHFTSCPVQCSRTSAGKQPLSRNLSVSVPGDQHCELNCRAVGFRFYVRLSERVIDGTPCGQNESSLCVAGKCMVGQRRKDKSQTWFSFSSFIHLQAVDLLTTISWNVHSAVFYLFFNQMFGGFCLQRCVCWDGDRQSHAIQFHTVFPKTETVIKVLLTHMSAKDSILVQYKHNCRFLSSANVDNFQSIDNIQ